MQVKYTSKVKMTSNGIAFVFGETYTVSADEAKRLVDTFGDKFEAIIKEVKPKEKPKRSVAKKEEE